MAPARRPVLLAAGSAAGAALLLAAPWLLDRYLLSVLILVCWSAYVGQAWNIMMGFAGQLSLGHALYIGLGAYTAGALYAKFGIGPWAGVPAAMAVASLAGAAVGALGFRFGTRGVYFALLTIAFAEFTRIGFDHFDWVGGSAGLFLPVQHGGAADVLNLRGGPALFYYVILALAALACGLCRVLLRSRIGYCWQAIREDQEAAEALGIDVFRYKLLAVVLSAALTALAGVFNAFYYNALFPEQSFAMARSIELIIPPIVGGLGTLAGPIVGAVVLTPLGEGLTVLAGLAGLDLPGLKQVFYGLFLLAVIRGLPGGLWPWLRRRFGGTER